MALNEREFFNENQEMKPTTYGCPKCRHRGEYKIRWIRRVKKERPPRGADERDRALFGKLRDYMVRVDDYVVCTRSVSYTHLRAHET